MDIITALAPIVGVVIGYALAGGFKRRPSYNFSTVVNGSAPTAAEVTAGVLLGEAFKGRTAPGNTR